MIISNSRRDNDKSECVIGDEGGGRDARLIGFLLGRDRMLAVSSKS